MTRTLFLAFALLSFAPLTGCGSDDDHAHGPDSHMHEEEAAAPAPTTTTETMLDTTGAAPDTTGFFDQAEAEAAEAGAHTHDDGTTHDH